MVGSSAGGDDDAAGILPEVLVVLLDFLKCDVGDFAVRPLDEAGPHGIGQGLGLFVDFLEHEVLPAALFGGRKVPVHVIGGLDDLIAVPVKEVHMVGVQDGKLLLVQEVDFPRIGEHGRHVACDEVFARAQAHDEGAFLAGRDDAVGEVLADDAEGVAAFEPFKALLNCLEDVPVLLVVVVDQMGNDLGVGLTAEDNALALQPGLEGQVVFDDAVVHDGDTAAFVHLGVRIDVARFPVGCPARVAYSQAAVHRLLGKLFLKELDGALDLAHKDVLAVVDRNARAVIAPVFKLLEPVNQDGRYILNSDISNDSAHLNPPPDSG